MRNISNWEVTATVEALEAMAKTGTITKVTAYAGTGTVNNDLMTQTELVNIKQELVVIEDGVLGNQRWFRLQLSNDGLSTGYTLNQIGIFVSYDNGPLFLYMLLQNRIGDVIPNETAVPDFLAEYIQPVVFGTGTYYDAPASPHGVITPDALAAALKRERERHLIISDTQPNQEIGDVWMDTSDQPYPGGEGGVTVINAVVSDTEPEDKKVMWFDIGKNI